MVNQVWIQRGGGGAAGGARPHFFMPAEIKTFFSTIYNNLFKFERLFVIRYCLIMLIYSGYHDDELEEFIIEQYSAAEGDRLSKEDLQKRVCKSMTGACSGVDIRSIRSLMQAQVGHVKVIKVM